MYGKCSKVSIGDSTTSTKPLKSFAQAQAFLHRDAPRIWIAWDKDRAATSNARSTASTTATISYSVATSFLQAAETIEPALESAARKT